MNVPVSYNYRMYAEDIKYYIPNIREDDLKWLCNKAANIYRRLGSCVDNFRCCTGPDRGIQYLKAMGRGCCGFSDTLVKNPKTGSEFWIGWNYGH